ncbi:hypothetical protein QRX42_07200 [Bifidobacterium sp. H6bp22N]|uniref:hypothetical protein n=1 Tax=Bifidobacterium polysaccharolyticum TaxID=2750967 RepID=UPI0028BD4CA8|nr:hypothetical protein [Bifidobacterium sp. H6bp22N]MDT7508220.1 hypothetical protein [Bifidobacterium sp. H6bp22N]
MMKHKAAYTMSFTSSNAGGVRWFDQKVTYDNLAQIADAARYTAPAHAVFSRFDIQKCLSLNSALTRQYGKPPLSDKKANDEYDKFIAQNLNVLAYSGVLSSSLQDRKRIYSVQNSGVLQRIAGDENQCRVFLIQYIEWVLKKFNWWQYITTYADSQHKQEDMDNLKKQFTNLLINTMSLGSKGSAHPGVEAGRIFSKVINLTAYALLIPGIKRGRVMDCPPTNIDLIYNKPNWRDIASKKPKQLTRQEYIQQSKSSAEYELHRHLKDAVMVKVKTYQRQISEIPDSSLGKATHIHHIFPVHSYPTLAEIPENMIALTPGQHLGQAHPDGNTHKIDLSFQRVCLSQKLETIKKSVLEKDGMYTYNGFVKVLEVGWGLQDLKPTYKSLRDAIINHVD